MKILNVTIATLILTLSSFSLALTIQVIDQKGNVVNAKKNSSILGQAPVAKCCAQPEQASFNKSEFARLINNVADFSAYVTIVGDESVEICDQDKFATELKSILDEKGIHSNDVIFQVAEGEVSALAMKCLAVR